jgi:hypothetical protein
MKMSDRKKKYLDGLERLAKTFFQAFAASLVVTGLDDWKEALAIGLGGGVLSVATSVASWQFGNKETSSALPASADPATPPGQGPE